MDLIFLAESEIDEIVSTLSTTSCCCKSVFTNFNVSILINRTYIILSIFVGHRSIHDLNLSPVILSVCLILEFSMRFTSFIQYTEGIIQFQYWVSLYHFKVAYNFFLYSCFVLSFSQFYSLTSNTSIPILRFLDPIFLSSTFHLIKLTLVTS